MAMGAIRLSLYLQGPEVVGNREQQPFLVKALKANLLGPAVPPDGLLQATPSHAQSRGLLGLDLELNLTEFIAA